MPLSCAAPLDAVLALITRLWGDHSPAHDAPMRIVGICGAQGSGKSTLAAGLARQLGEQGLACATLSLDDLYLTRAQREALAHQVHPLFATRGVPGTHDIALGLETIDTLARGEPARLPRFDKARDDRVPGSEWPLAPRNTSLLILEGWCLGVPAQAESALFTPINALERHEDPRGIWRSAANAALAGPYTRLWDRIDRLVFLAAPAFETVLAWRTQQEMALRARSGPSAPGVMDNAALTRFVAHYERLTRHALAVMLGLADLTLQLDEARHLVGRVPE